MLCTSLLEFDTVFSILRDILFHNSIITQVQAEMLHRKTSAKVFSVIHWKIHSVDVFGSNLFVGVYEFT